MTAPEPTSPSDVSPIAHRRLSLLAAGMFAIGTDSYVIAPLLPLIARELGVGIAAAAQLITAYALAYAVSSPFVATATSSWPRQRILTTGLAIFALANVWAALTPDFSGVLLARAFAGLGAAVFAPAASASAASLVGADRRGRALSFMMIGLSSATAFGSPLGTLVGSLASWRTVFLLVAALAAIVCAGVAATIRIDADQRGVPLAERLRLLRDARALTTLLTTFLVLSGLYVTYTYISVIFDRPTHNDGTCMAILQSILGFAGIAGASMAGRLTDRWGSDTVVRTLLIVATVDFALMPWTSAHAASAAAAVLIWGICGWGFVVPQQHRLVSLAPASAPILLALYTMAVYGGSSASGIIGAAALQFVDPHRLPLIGAALILSGLVVDECSRRRRKRLSFAMPPA